MTIGQFTLEATKEIKRAGIASARLDVLILLEDELRLDRSLIMAHPDQILHQKNLQNLNTKIAQRCNHKPLAYIRCRCQFYGREFIVSEAVLIPRPETENIIDVAKRLSLPKQPKIIDVGTGSGCIGISLALEIPGAQVTTTDTNSKALEITQQNIKKHGVGGRLEPKQQYLLAGKTNYDLVVANLPYIPDGMPINKAANFEPKSAIFAGYDGMDLYHQFWAQLIGAKARFVITESLEPQHGVMIRMARAAGYRLLATEGLVQLFELYT